MPTQWQEFEERVRRVYDVLLNLKDEGTVVSRDVKVNGRDGQVHQFDVFYQFTRGGIGHAVAIECKNHSRPIEKNHVLAFKAKVEDVPGLRGLIIAANGFQEGAKYFASKNGIIALEAKDLPGVGELLGARLESVALPDETTIGEPFWAIYEMRNGKNTGTPLGRLEGTPKVGFLFLSKSSAQRFIDSDPLLSDCWSVRGLPQRCLRSFILIIDSFRALPMIVAKRGHSGAVEGSVWDRQLFIEEWYVGRVPIPMEPLVAPSH